MNQIMKDFVWFANIHNKEREQNIINNCDYNTRVNHIRRFYVFITNPVFLEYLKTNCHNAKVVILIQTIIEKCMSLIHELIIIPKNKTINDQLVESIDTFVTNSQLYGVLFTNNSKRNYIKARESYYYQSSPHRPHLRRSERIATKIIADIKKIK